MDQKQAIEKLGEFGIHPAREVYVNALVALAAAIRTSEAGLLADPSIGYALTEPSDVARQAQADLHALIERL